VTDLSNGLFVAAGCGMTTKVCQFNRSYHKHLPGAVDWCV